MHLYLKSSYFYNSPVLLDSAIAIQQLLTSSFLTGGRKPLEGPHWKKHQLAHLRDLQSPAGSSDFAFPLLYCPRRIQVQVAMLGLQQEAPMNHPLCDWRPYR
jgi:hypothetical protein